MMYGERGLLASSSTLLIPLTNERTFAYYILLCEAEYTSTGRVLLNMPIMIASFTEKN